MKNKRILEKHSYDEDKFAGEYIAIVKGKIVAHGKQPKKVIMAASKIGPDPMLAKVPSKGWKEAMIL